MSTRTIALTVPFANVTPKELFDFWMDPNKHGALIGSNVTVSREEGALFSAFDGFVTGRNLLVVPDRLIVQTWRGSVWVHDDTDSVLILFFEEIQDGAQIHMVHAGLPPQFEERWDELYWKPLRQQFNHAS